MVDLFFAQALRHVQVNGMFDDLGDSAKEA